MNMFNTPMACPSVAETAPEDRNILDLGHDDPMVDTVCIYI
jgi:hypothetical protein